MNPLHTFWQSLVRMGKSRALTLGAGLLLSLSTSAAQFVEVAADLEITNWRYQDETGLLLKNTRSYSVRCVVGTNAWLIENRARTNVTESVWFVDGNIIRQTASSPDSLPSEPGFETLRRGSRPVSILSAPDGYPGGELLLNLPWFVFSSGPYLKRPRRTVPLPTATLDREAFGFRDETTVFTDSFGLPRHVAFRTAQGQLKCEYQVQQSTNVSGWNFPTAFTVVQNEPNSLGQWNRQITVTGHVTSIGLAKNIELPEDVQERLTIWEQSPRRRK